MRLWKNENCFVVICGARRCVQNTAYSALRLRLAFCSFLFSFYIKYDTFEESGG